MSRPDSRPSAASAAPRESGPAAASAADPSARPAATVAGNSPGGATGTSPSPGGATGTSPSPGGATGTSPSPGGATGTSPSPGGAKPDGGVTVRVTGGRAVRTDAGGRKFEAQPGRWTPTSAGGAAFAAAAAGIAGVPQEDESKDDPEAFSAAARTAVPADTSTAARRTTAAVPPGPNGNLQARSPVVAANGREAEEDLVAPRTWETSLGVTVLGCLVLGLGGLVGYRYWPLATGKSLAEGPVAAVTGTPAAPRTVPGKETKSPTLLIPGRKDSLFPPRDPNVKTVHYEQSEASERTPPTETPPTVPGAIPSTLPTERIAGERIPSARDAEELAPEVPVAPEVPSSPVAGGSPMRIRTNPNEPAGAAAPKAGASFASFPSSPVGAAEKEPPGASGSAFASPFPATAPSDRAAPPTGDVPPEKSFMGVPGEMPLPTSRRAAPRSPRAGSTPREPSNTAAFPTGAAGPNAAAFPTGAAGPDAAAFPAGAVGPDAAAFPAGAVGAYPTARDGAAGEKSTPGKEASAFSGDKVDMPPAPSGAFPREPLPTDRAAPAAKTSAWPPATPRAPAAAYASPWDTTAPTAPAGTASDRAAPPASPREPVGGAKPGTGRNGFAAEGSVPSVPKAPAETPFPSRPADEPAATSTTDKIDVPRTERSPREATAVPTERVPAVPAATAPLVEMPTVPVVPTERVPEVPAAPTERAPAAPVAPTDRVPLTPPASPWPSSPPNRQDAPVGTPNRQDAPVGTPVEREPLPPVEPTTPPAVEAAPPSLPGGFREAGSQGNSTPRSPEPGFRAPSAPAASFAADEEDVPALPIRDGRYEVRPGDNYWTLAQRFYGDGGYHRALAAAQATRSGRGGLLRVGDLVTAPPLGELRGQYPQLCPKEPQPTGTTAAAAPRTYRVHGGETLHDVARTQLGKPGRWIEIYDLNQDNLAATGAALPAGLELILPEDPAAGPAPEMATPRVRFEPAR